MLFLLAELAHVFLLKNVNKRRFSFVLFSAAEGGDSPCCLQVFKLIKSLHSWAVLLFFRLCNSFDSLMKLVYAAFFKILFDSSSCSQFVLPWPYFETFVAKYYGNWDIRCKILLRFPNLVWEKAKETIVFDVIGKHETFS